VTMVALFLTWPSWLPAAMPLPFVDHVFSVTCHAWSCFHGHVMTAPSLYHPCPCRAVMLCLAMSSPCRHAIHGHVHTVLPCHLAVHHRYLVTLVGLAQPVIAHYRPDPKADPAGRETWFAVHKWLGWLSVLLGLYNVRGVESN
jgi:hypothetical protein